MYKYDVAIITNYCENFAASLRDTLNDKAKYGWRLKTVRRMSEVPTFRLLVIMERKVLND